VARVGTSTRKQAARALWCLVLVLAGCFGATWYWSRNAAHLLGLEAAIVVMEDPTEPDHARCSAALRVHYLTKSGMEALVGVSKGEGKLARDARIYLDKTRKVAAGN
jgi:hypothetical protein